MNEYQDIELICVNGEPFTWTAGEQEFLNGLKDAGKIPNVQQPKRCPPCRKENKEKIDQRKREAQGK